MKSKTLIYLAFMAAGLGLLLWFVELNERDRRDVSVSREQLLPGYDPGRIESISIEREGWRLDIERREHVWRIVRPFAGRADSEKINRMLAYVDKLPIRDELTHEQCLERGLQPLHFGLDAPLAYLRLADGDREYSILLGVESPLDQGLYIQIAGIAGIFLTDRALADLVPENMHDLRERTFFRGAPSDIVRLDIKPYAGSYIQAVREDGGEWMLRQPVAAKTDSDVMRERLNMLFDVRALKYLPDAAGALLAGYALDDEDAMLRISLWGKDTQEPTELYFGATVADDDDHVYARRGDSAGVFVLPRAIRDAFMVRPGDLRDRRVFEVEPWEATGMEIKSGGQSVLLRLRETGWSVAQPVEWYADDEKAMQMTVRACELRVARFIEGAVTNSAALGLDPARHSLTLWRRADLDRPAPADAGESAEKLLIGGVSADGGEYYARRYGGSQYFTLSAELLEGRLIGKNKAGMAFTDPLIYHDRSVFAVKPETVWRIDLRRGDKRQVVERDSDGEWKAVQPAGSSVNAQQVQTVLNTAKSLRALRVEQRGIEQPAVFGFNRPGLELTLSLTGTDAISVTLVSGFRARTDGIFAMVQGRDLVFAISREVIDRLGRDLASGGN